MTGTGGANKFKYTGHERDAESGLDHTLYRQLSSAQGRWLSPDSHRGSPANPQSWNRYTYGGNNPCNSVDPDGAQSVTNCWRDSEGVWHCDTYEPFPSGDPFPSGEDDWDNTPWTHVQSEANILRDNLERAVRLLDAAFKQNSKPCTDLFNGFDPMLALNQMVNPDPGSSSYHGQINWRERLPGRAQVVGLGPADQDGKFAVVDIDINLDWWNWEAGEGLTGDIERARLLLHELGHVMNVLRGAPGSQFFQGDENDFGRQTHNESLPIKCVPDGFNPGPE